MFQEQDLIQSFAHTYADRIIAEAFADVVGSKDVKETSLEAVMNKVFQLHLLSTLERDLAWFMENDVLTTAQGEEVGHQSSYLSRVGEDTFEMYLRYRYTRGCIFFVYFRYFRYRCHS